MDWRVGPSCRRHERRILIDQQDTRVLDIEAAVRVQNVAEIHRPPELVPEGALYEVNFRDELASRSVHPGEAELQEGKPFTMRFEVAPSNIPGVSEDPVTCDRVPTVRQKPHSMSLAIHKQCV